MLKRKNNHHNVVLELLEENDFKIMAEVGVWKTSMAKYIIARYPNIEEFWGIDPWQPMGKRHGGVSKITKEGWDRAYLISCNVMVHYPMYRALRLESTIAANLFPNEYFDLVYIDALHDYDSVRNDILAWKPKIRKGGTLAGHDWHLGGHKGHNIAGAVESVFDKEDIVILKRSVWSVRM
jgi:hypothetical protein